MFPCNTIPKFKTIHHQRCKHMEPLFLPPTSFTTPKVTSNDSKPFVVICNPEQASRIESILPTTLLSCQREGPKTQWLDVIEFLKDFFADDNLKFYFAEDTAQYIVAEVPFTRLVLCADFQTEISVREIHRKLQQAMNTFWESDQQVDRGRILDLPNGCQYTIQDLTIKIYTSSKRHLGISAAYGFQVDVMTREIRCGEGYHFMDTADRISRFVVISDQMKVLLSCNLTEDCHQNPEALSQMLHGIQMGYSFVGNQRLLLQTALSRQDFEKEFAAHLDVEFGDDQTGKIFQQLNLLTLAHLHNIPLDPKSLPLPEILVKIHRCIGPLFLSFFLSLAPKPMDASTPFIVVNFAQDKNRRTIQSIKLSHLSFRHYLLALKPQQALFECIEFLSSYEGAWQEIHAAFEKFFYIQLTYTHKDDAIVSLTRQLDNAFIVTHFEHANVFSHPKMKIFFFTKLIDSFIIVANLGTNRKGVLLHVFSLIKSNLPLPAEFQESKVKLINVVEGILVQPVHGEPDPLLYRNAKKESEQKESAEGEVRYLFDAIPWDEVLANDSEIVEVVVKSIERVSAQCKECRTEAEIQQYAALVCSISGMVKNGSIAKKVLEDPGVCTILNCTLVSHPIRLLNTYINILFFDATFAESNIKIAVNLALRVCKGNKKGDVSAGPRATPEEVNTFILNFINNIIQSHSSVSFINVKDDIFSLFELILKNPTKQVLKKFLEMIDSLLRSSNVENIKLAIELFLNLSVIYDHKEMALKFKNEIKNAFILTLENMYKVVDLNFYSMVCMTIHIQISTVAQTSKEFEFFQQKVMEFLKDRLKLIPQIQDQNTLTQFLTWYVSVESLYVQYMPNFCFDIQIQLFSCQQKCAKSDFKIIDKILWCLHKLLMRNFYPTEHKTLLEFERIVDTLIHDSLNCFYKLPSSMIRVFEKLISHFQYNDKTIRKTENLLRTMNAIGDRLFDRLAFRSEGDHVDAVMIYDKTMEIIESKVTYKKLIAKCITSEHDRMVKLTHEVFVFGLVIDGAKDRFAKSNSEMPYDEFIKNHYNNICSSQEDEKLQGELIVKIQENLKIDAAAAKKLLLGIRLRIEKFEVYDFLYHDYARMHAGFLINNYINTNPHCAIMHLKMYFIKQTQEFFDHYMIEEVREGVKTHVIKFEGRDIFFFQVNAKSKQLTPYLAVNINWDNVPAIKMPTQEESAKDKLKKRREELQRARK